MTDQVQLLAWNPSAYDLVSEWWRGHKQEPVPLGLLPCYGALAVDDEGEPRVASWYTLDPVNQVAHLDWLVTNPSNTIGQTKRYALALLDFLIASATEDGAIIMYAQARHPWLCDQAAKVGFERIGPPNFPMGRAL